MKKEKITKEDIKNLKDDSWIYILLLSTLIILSESLKSYTFYIKTELTLSILIIPIIFFIMNYITKKYGFKKGLFAILISILNIILFTVVMNFIIGSDIKPSEINGEIIGLSVSGIVNILIYTFLLRNTKCPKILILLTYIFSLILMYLVYTVIKVNMIILDEFWIGYFLTLCIQFFECIIITIFDSKIKSGI